MLPEPTIMKSFCISIIEPQHWTGLRGGGGVSFSAQLKYGRSLCFRECGKGGLMPKNQMVVNLGGKGFRFFTFFVNITNQWPLKGKQSINLYQTIKEIIITKLKLKSNPLKFERNLKMLEWFLWLQFSADSYRTLINQTKF